MKKIISTFAIAILLGGTLSFASTTASAAGQRVLKISHQWPANTDFRDQLARKFAAEVEKRTNGALKFQIYAGASLYKPSQEFDAMAGGALDMTIFGLAHASGKMPPISITLMPGLIRNYKQAYGWENAPIGKWLEKYLNDHGAVIISWIWQAGGVASRDKPILVPNDIKGLKTRGAGKMINRMLQKAGGAITPIPSSEAYNAMQSGVIDAIWTSSASLVSYRLNEVSKYVTTAQGYTFWYMFEPMLMSKSVYDSLTPHQQKIIKEVGHSLEQFALDSCKKDDQHLASVYRKSGSKVLTMNEQQFSQWKAVAKESSYADFAKTVPNGAKLLKMAEAVPY